MSFIPTVTITDYCNALAGNSICWRPLTVEEFDYAMLRVALARTTPKWHTRMCVEFTFGEEENILSLVILVDQEMSEGATLAKVLANRVRSNSLPENLVDFYKAAAFAAI